MGLEGGQEYLVHGVAVRLVTEVNSGDYDAVVVVTGQDAPLPQALEDFIGEAQRLDRGLDQCAGVVRCPRVSGQRLVLSPTGALTPYDDVRSIGEAMRVGVERAIRAGSVRPVVAILPHPRWPRAEFVALLAALEPLHVPLQVRETYPSKAHGVIALGVYGEGVRGDLPALLKDAVALELARGVARDIGGADPERMTPAAAANYLQEEFPPNGLVRVTVLDDRQVIEKRYPLFAAVDRAAASVPRHAGRIVFLEYAPEGYEEAVFVVGKGVTYDTGGCDVKVGGAMAGMSRDKCGAAAAAALVRACAELRPRCRVLAALAFVRNSVGEEAYVADELVRSSRGLAVRIGNTDAEGRMAMGDLLAEMGDLAALESVPCQVYTVATLTGHAHRAMGDGYTVAMDNHAAHAARHAHALQRCGEDLADMIEISRIRREDLSVHRGVGAGDDVLQALSLPSTAVPRGHQGPAGFLLLVSGLASGPVRYTHLDVAASAGAFPHAPTAAPLVALAHTHKLLRSLDTTS